MNLLKNHRCYLAGAIDRVEDRGNGWREYITPILKELNVEVFNPLKKPTKCGVENEDTAKHKVYLKQNDKFDELSKLMKTIRSVDLRMVDISDFIVVNLDIETHPCGTLEEIFWANRQKKPILIRIEQGKRHVPDWLFGTIPHHMFFDSWIDVKTYLEKINTGELTDNTGRWCFFER